jgi:hypothetical protein
VVAALLVPVTVFVDHQPFVVARLLEALTLVVSTRHKL